MSNSITNRLPGFTAEKSLYENEEQYLLTTTEGSHSTIGPAAVRGETREAAGGCYYCDPYPPHCVQIPCVYL